MSKYEGAGDNLPDMKHTELSSPDAQAFFLELIFRNNAQAEYEDDPTGVLLWDQKNFNLPELDTASSNGNEVAVRFSKKHSHKSTVLPLGYFSPSRGGFVIFDNDGVVRPNEVENITSLAEASRKIAIEEFDKSKPNVPGVRIDYTHEEVREMHAEHNELLTTSGLLFNALDAYNYSRRETPNPTPLNADEFTHAAIFLQSNGSKLYHSLGLRVWGSFTEANGIKIRQDQQTITVAEADPEADAMFTFVPGDRDILPTSDIDLLAEKAVDVDVISMITDLDGLKFNTVQLGVERRAGHKA